MNNIPDYSDIPNIPNIPVIPDDPGARGDMASAAARRIAGAIAGAARVAAPIVVAIVIIAAAVFAGASVARLAMTIGLPLPMVILTPISTVGVVVAMVALLMLSDHAPVRAVAIITLLFWLPLLVMLVGLDVTLTSPPIGYDAAGQPIYVVTIPDAVINVARVGAGFLPGLVLLPAVTTIVAWRREGESDLLAELGHYASNALKAILLVSTWAAGVYFGVSRGMPPEIAFFASAILELSFLLALTRVLCRAEPLPLHTMAMIAFGGAIGIVALETMSAATGIKALPGLDRVGEAMYPLMPSAGLAYIVLSSIRWGEGVGGGRSIADAIADRIYSIRSGLSRIALAIRGVREQPQLKAPRGAMTIAASEADIEADIGEDDEAADVPGIQPFDEMGDGDEKEETPRPKRRRRGQ